MTEKLVPGSSTSQSSARGRVVIAEDDQTMRKMLVNAFRRDAYDVIEAKNGAELLHVIGALRIEQHDGISIDLVVSDLRMPLLSGLDVLAHVRRESATMPFILITAFGDDATHTLAAELGASAVFDKPFDVGALRRRARELLAG